MKQYSPIWINRSTITEHLIKFNHYIIKTLKICQNKNTNVVRKKIHEITSPQQLLPATDTDRNLIFVYSVAVPFRFLIPSMQRQLCAHSEALVERPTWSILNCITYALGNFAANFLVGVSTSTNRYLLRLGSRENGAE